MKKILYHITVLIFLIMLISISEGITIVGYSVNPETIGPGGTTTITVTTDEPGEGNIWVKPPDGGGPITSVDVSFTTGTIPPLTVSVEYPGDFGPDASTATLGEYEAHVVVHDHSAAKSFWVSWNVVPASPIGSIGLLLTLLAAFGTYALTKRRVVSLR